MFTILTRKGIKEIWQLDFRWSIAMSGIAKEARMALSIDDVVRLKEHDVEPCWLKALYEAGMTDLSIDQIIELAA